MSTKPEADGADVIAFRDAAEFDAWLAEIAAAKADGQWDAAYASQKHATVPPDLAAALDTSPRAAQAFESLNKTSQYAVILDLVTARTPRTRSSHLRKAMDALETPSD